MNKISKVCFILMGGLLSLSIPTYFAVSSFLHHEQKINPAKAAISELEPTNITLSPVAEIDPLDLADGSYYFMVAFNELNGAGSNEYEGALLAFDETYMALPINIGSDLSINIDDNLAGVIAGILEFEIADSTSYSVINKSAYRYLGAQYYQYYSSWDIILSVDRPTSEFVFSLNNDQMTYSINVTGSSDGASNGASLYYNENHNFELNENEASKVCLYRLPEGFFEEYSWSAKFSAIEQTDNADDLLEMWQNLTIYEKENLFSNFFEGDYEDSGSQQSPDYGGYSGELAGELINLQQKYSLYKTIVGAEYQYPFACKNIDEDISIDNTSGTINGFSSINRLVYIVDEGETYLSYVNFKLSPTGSYTFAYEGDDGISADFAGKTVNFYYGVFNYKTTLSTEPLTVTFSVKQEVGSLPNDDPLPAEFIYHINTSTGDTSSIEYNFNDCFMLESIPNGYDIAIVTESFYDTFSYALDEQTEDTFPLSIVHYFNENKPISYAYDENGEVNYIEGETTYYILYRLSGNSSALFSDCCGYKTFTTGIEPSYEYLAKADNYNAFNELKESDRFSQYISDCEAYYNSFYDSIYNEIDSFEEPVQYEEYTQKISFEDRWYIEASRIMLLYDYYINDYNSSRTLAVVESLNDGLDAFVEEYVPLDKEAVDDYVDSNMTDFQETYMLYFTQEDTARRMVDYFNNLINYYFFTGDLTEAIVILKTYTEDVYACEDYNEISTYETNYRSEIQDWFIAHI